ncbi:hypothetical protein EZV62_013573 [Acer yangbiense]|uniref:CTLH domain-containing protein n=1 Tax=Acer yangbiense TaxID=1000413 RepID=A0A5C7HZ35_9ROSI|nr:hypothetical protein EZV62_013573 [Acer yangbiense]
MEGFRAAVDMSSHSRELVFLILQYLNEEGLKQSARMLERETGYYFDMNFFEEMVLAGNWEEAEKYLSSFTKVEDNRYSTKIYFDMRKQNFLEALDSNDNEKALNILSTDLSVFASGSTGELFNEMTQLLTLVDIRQHESLADYGDTNSARRNTMIELKRVIEANPIFHGKLNFPTMNGNRLRRLINQSLNWQHLCCTYPHPIPYMNTLFEDHVCHPPVYHSLVQSANSNTVSSQASPDPAFAASTGYPVSDEATSAVFTYPGLNRPDSLPKTVARILNEESSSPVSMDFHPVLHTLLLVGTNTGDIGLWDVFSGAKFLSRNFKVWDMGRCSILSKRALVKDPLVSVKRVIWSPDGCLFGVAYSKHIAQLYSYHGGSDVRTHLEIDAHLGAVNDLAFSYPNEQLLVLTCGDDMTIKVWDSVTGVRMYIFKSHNGPVYSLCSQSKQQNHFFFSTSVEGKIKAWIYDDDGERLDYNAPGFGRTRMAYTTDCQRLFSCGTSRKGETFLVEWDEGSIKNVYQGLQNNSQGVVQFGITKNQFLAAGDDHAIKFWDMDKVELLTTTDADGDLPENPHFCFNKMGTLLAVIANGNKIKILATDIDLQLMNLPGSYYTDAASVLSNSLRMLALNPSTSAVADAAVAEGDDALVNAEPDISGEADDGFKSSVGNPIIIRPRCLPLTLPSYVNVNKISRLVYYTAGNAILALGSNGVHLRWKWPKDDDLNQSGQATAKVTPQLWQPKNSLQLLINDVSDNNPEASVSCFALSKNNSYLISASGGTITLFNLITYKAMTNFLPPAPMATCIAFYPQNNNIIAIGMDDSTILIYNVPLAQVIAKLKGHRKRVTDLAFSSALNVLISSGADAQISLWNLERWEKQKCKFLQMPGGNMPVVWSDTYIQFHQDETRFLSVHETLLAIYEAKELKCLLQVSALTSLFLSPVLVRPVKISQATFSCDSQMVYAGFVDGTIFVFDASKLELKCTFGFSIDAYPNAIASHPQKPTQFAVGQTDGTIIVFEPEEPEGEWFVLPRDDISPLQPPSLPESSEQPLSLPESSVLTKPMLEFGLLCLVELSVDAIVDADAAGSGGYEKIHTFASNKKGTLLAVIENGNKIKILATDMISIFN